MKQEIKERIILGVDPGTLIAGYGILIKDVRGTRLAEHGYLKMAASKHLSERISIFHDFFTEKITAHHITDLALETPFLGKNAQNFLKLGYIRGILYLLAHKHNMHLHEFSPTQVKQSVTGWGGASKEQVSRVVAQLFPAMAKQEKYDVTDAIAVTLCGLWHQQKSLLN